VVVANELKPVISQLKSDIVDPQSELKKTKAALKFDSDEHGKADAECEQLREKTGDKGGEEKVPMTTETDVEKAADAFVAEMDKRNEEPAERVSSHRILHLSCAQFDAWIALKQAVADKHLSIEDQNGVKMLTTLQKVLGNKESPETALAKWREMPKPQKDEVWKMYKTIAP
jgi:hypothetical protein